jgi:hypothetical protein
MTDRLFIKPLEDYTNNIYFIQVLGLEILLSGYGYLHMAAYSNSMNSRVSVTSFRFLVEFLGSLIYTIISSAKSNILGSPPFLLTITAILPTCLPNSQCI